MGKINTERRNCRKRFWKIFFRARARVKTTARFRVRIRIWVSHLFSLKSHRLSRHHISCVTTACFDIFSRSAFLCSIRTVSIFFGHFWRWSFFVRPNRFHSKEHITFLLILPEGCGRSSNFQGKLAFSMWLLSTLFDDGDVYWWVCPFASLFFPHSEYVLPRCIVSNTDRKYSRYYCPPLSEFSLPSLKVSKERRSHLL